MSRFLVLLFSTVACAPSGGVTTDSSTTDGSRDSRADSTLPDVGIRDTRPGDSGPPVLPKWILSIDNMEANTVHRLVRISVASEDFGAVSDICADIALPASVPSDNIISSLTFNSGRLYASGRGTEEGDTMMLIDPCDCTATAVGGYGYTFVAGITSNGDQAMFGISGIDDVLISIDPDSALGTLMRNLGKSWTTVGLTWTGPADDALWVITGATDELVRFSAADGAEGRSVTLDYDFGPVGMEYHPTMDAIYACSASGELLTVDPESGGVAVGPSMGIDNCNNLAAPFGSVECVN